MRNVHAIARRHVWAAVAGLMVLAAVPAAAQDKVKVGVFPVSSSLPYFVALERGFFKEQNIEPETVRLIGGPPNVAAMITNQIDAAAVLVTIEGMNADLHLILRRGRQRSERHDNAREQAGHDW